MATLSINELPYKKRTLKENIIIAGLWFGESKPCMRSFLKPFHNTFQKLSEGFEASLPDKRIITVCSILLCGTCDMPAKAQVLNMVQFNGCYRCTQPGETVASGKGHIHAYPYKDEQPSEPPRTLEGFHRDAKKAYEEKKQVGITLE